MMKMGMGSGSMVITDDNKTIVSQELMDEVNDKFQKPDGADDSKKPDMTLKD